MNEEPIRTDTPAEETDPAAGLKAAYEAKLTRMQEEHRAALERARVDSEVKLTLVRLGARNPALAAKAVDLSGITVDEAGVNGVRESVERLRESDPYLFAPQGNSTFSREEDLPLPTGGIHGTVRRDPADLPDSEYYKTVWGLR